MPKFHIGQRIIVIANALKGHTGTINSILMDTFYCIGLDTLSALGTLPFLGYEIKLIDSPGTCNKCSSIVPKDRTLCCDCMKNV